jgi:hypothetical protein
MSGVLASFQPRFMPAQSSARAVFLLSMRDGPLQRRATVTTGPATTPSIVRAVLDSPGRPLESATRAFLEPRFGHDFRQVRVHTNTLAAESAQALHALAFTVAPHLVFNSGRYAPQTSNGRRLLAHELSHVIQQGGSSSGISPLADIDHPAEREAEAVAEHVHESSMRLSSLLTLRHPQGLYRQQAPAPTSGMTRTEFEDTMKRRFGVSRVHTGTEAEQTKAATPRGGVPPGGITLPQWQSWDPGPASTTYSRIIDSFEDFANAIGGVPEVKEIIFFNVDYRVNPAGIAIPQPNVGASFGGGLLTIYHATETMDKALPVSRSNVQGTYPPVGVGVAGIPGQSPGAPLPYPTRETSIKRIITHELGHGLAESVGQGLFDEYRPAVGWTAGFPWHLFDIGVPAVANAFNAGTPPPSAFEIVENNWNDPKWVEQPLSNYSVAGGPGEDFAEAVMAFVDNPNLLLSRSPQRFKFLNDRKDKWLPKLIQLPEIGDFPESHGDTSVA